MLEKINLNGVDLPINAGGGLEDVTLLHTITLEEDTQYIYQELDNDYEYIVVEFENLWCVEGTSCGVSVSVNNGNLISIITSIGSPDFVNSSSYPSKGIAIIEKVCSTAIVTFGGINTAGNRGKSGNVNGIDSTETDLTDSGINVVGFCLSGWATHTMNAGAIINIYGR